MRVEEHDHGALNAVLAEMVMSTAFLGRVAAYWDRHAFPSSWQNRVAGWCVEHFQKHNKAPRKGVAAYYDDWAATADAGEAEALSRFLANLSRLREERGKLDPGLAADLAAKGWTEARLDRLVEKVRAAREAGDVTRAAEAVEAFRRVELGEASGTDPFCDREAVKAVFHTERFDPVIEVPDTYGDLRHFLAGHLCRNCLVGFLGGEKSGKSWWLFELAMLARDSRRNVAWFDAGDMTADQVDERVVVRAAAHPTRSDDGWPCTVEVPTAVTPPVSRDEPPGLASDERTFTAPLTAKEAWRAVQRAQKRIGATPDHQFFRRACYPNGSCSVARVRAVLEEYARGGFRPDVVVVDYADILAPLDPRQEKRHQVDATWKGLRAISQELHCLVLTACQAKRESYTARTVRGEHVSEDKRIRAHVTSLLTISATEEERRLGVCRLGVDVWRNGRPRPPVYVAGCLALGRVATASAWVTPHRAGRHGKPAGEVGVEE